MSAFPSLSSLLPFLAGVVLVRTEFTSLESAVHMKNYIHTSETWKIEGCDRGASDSWDCEKKAVAVV